MEITFPPIILKYPKIQFDEIETDINCSNVVIRCATIVNNLDFYQLYNYSKFAKINNKDKSMVYKLLKDRIVESVFKFLNLMN